MEWEDVPLLTVLLYFLLGACPAFAVVHLFRSRIVLKSSHFSQVGLAISGVTFAAFFLSLTLLCSTGSMAGGVTVRDRLAAASALGASCTLAVASLVSYVSYWIGRLTSEDEAA